MFAFALDSVELAPSLSLVRRAALGDPVETQLYTRRPRLIIHYTLDHPEMSLRRDVKRVPGEKMFRVHLLRPGPWP